MKITFENTRDDYWKFNKYLMINHPTFRRNMLVNILAVPVFLAFIGYMLKDSFTTIILTSTLGGFLGFFLIIYLMKRQISKLPLEEKGSLLGEHTVQIDEKGLKENTSVNESNIAWNGVRDIVSDKNNIYIFIDSLMAFVIPKRAFISEKETEEFLNTTIKFWKQAK